MPRRVLFMISSMRGGGSERQTLLFLKHLDRTRFTPFLYLSERAGDLLSQIPDDVPIHSFDETPVQRGLYYPGRILSQQVSHLRDLLRAASIDVIYDRTFHMTLIAGPAAYSAGVPRISTIVSPPHLALPLVESRFVWLKRRRLAKAYRQSKSVVAVSQQAAQSAANYYRLHNDCVKVIVNPVDIEATRQAAKPKTVYESNDYKTIVCVGRMTQEKGHRDLIDAMAQTESNWPSDAPPLRVRLIGDGPLRADLQRHANAVIHKHKIEFLGTQPNPAPEIAAADALILPSHFEGMPNVVLESMAIGIPVIATRAGGTVELERDQPTILWAEPNRPDSLASAILKCVAEPSLMTGYADAATQLVHQHHDVRITTRRIEDLLDGE